MNLEWNYNTIYTTNNIIMAVNAPIWDNARKWAVRNRIQVFNPKTKLWAKINTETNLIMDNKMDWDPFKWVRRYKVKK